ncbi:MAG: hypothetical protein PUC46_08425, partial [Lachnospiraceae bacterium]|nr:hypothetical protein [Lachnospiraceae bacterium]
HPAIIDHEQKDRIISILSANAKLRRPQRAVRHPHIFGGIIYCQRCQKIMWASPAAKKNHLTNFSKYVCPNFRTDKNPRCRFTSDLKVGEFIFNFILNLLNLQHEWTADLSNAEIQSRLLFGMTFRGVDHMDNESLNSIRAMLSSSRHQIFGKSRIEKKKPSRQTAIKTKRDKILRAMDRLNSLYLFSDDSMTEQQYLIQKNKLNEDLKAIDIKMQETASNPAEYVPDEQFVEAASDYIIQNILTGRNYINYEHLAETTDPEVLKTFVGSIICSIYVDSGNIVSISFRNHLECHFFYK